MIDWFREAKIITKRDFKKGYTMINKAECREVMEGCVDKAIDAFDCELIHDQKAVDWLNNGGEVTIKFDKLGCSVRCKVVKKGR